MMFSRRRFLMITLALSVVIAAGAQQIDASDARIRLAVPDVLVIDNLQIDGAAWIAYLSADEDGLWEVTYLRPQVESVIPATVVLDLARLSVSPNGVLTIEDIYLDGEFYSGTIDFSDDLWSVEGFSFDPADPPTMESNALLAELAAILAPDTGAPDGSASTVLEEPLERIAPEDERASTIDADLREPQPGDEAEDVDAAGYNAAIADLTARLDRVERAVATLSDAGAARAAQIQRAIEAMTLEVRRATGEASAMTVRMQAIEEATQTLLDRSERIEDLARSLSTGQADTEVAANAWTPTISLEWARANFGSPASVDFSSTTVLRGTWDRTATAARQNDPEELFAKLDLPFVQDGSPRLYRMITRALDPEWVGVGIHLTVTEVERPRGYGHGRSLLVWLTRDPATYGSEDTYLEVYRSFDDVNMDRIAQAHIETNLTDQHALEVLIDPGTGYITLAVNGVEYLRYRLDAPIEEGFSLAIRSLGRAEFRQLEYRSIRR